MADSNDKGKVVFLENDNRKPHITPEATGKFAYLNKPDMYKGKHSHKISLEYDPDDAEWSEFLEMVLEFEIEQRLQDPVALAEAADMIEKLDLKQTPEEFIKATTKRPSMCKTEKVKDKDGNFTGESRQVIRASRTVKNPTDYKPVPVVDANRQPMDPEVWGGSIVRISCGIGYYTGGIGCGTKLYLRAVQVVENAKSGGGDTSNDFGAPIGDPVGDEPEGSPDDF